MKKKSPGNVFLTFVAVCLLSVLAGILIIGFVEVILNPNYTKMPNIMENGK